MFFLLVGLNQNVGKIEDLLTESLFLLTCVCPHFPFLIMAVVSKTIPRPKVSICHQDEI